MKPPTQKSPTDMEKKRMYPLRVENDEAPNSASALTKNRIPT